MSRKRAKKGARTVDEDANKIVARLPNELLLEVWDLLPPMERICVSQVCRKWRNIALSIPKLWSYVAFVSTSHMGWCRCDRQPASAGPRSIYRPRSGSNNFEFCATLLLRSQQLPLELTLDACGARFRKPFYAILRPHCGRIVRLHFVKAENRAFNDFVADCHDPLLALRTVTAGFDEREVEYAHLPARLTAGARLPALRQIHLGADAPADFVHWRSFPLPGLRELTLTPSAVEPIPLALLSCSNLMRLTLVMAVFEPPRQETGRIKTQIRSCVQVLARVRELCVTNISGAHENFILTHFDDARIRHLTLDYVGRARRPGSSWFLSLPSPCDALADPVRLTLKLRDGVYEITVVDPNGLRREIFLDHDTIRMAPGLWNCYLKKKIVASATVDALAWDYFADELPYTCSIPELELVVLQHPSELLGVSLAHFTKLHKLRIDVGKRGMTFDSDRAVVQKLVETRGDQQPLAVLSLSPNATYGEDVEKLASVLEHL